MTKVSEVRSALRRMALVKAADANLRAQGYGAQPKAQPVVQQAAVRQPTVATRPRKPIAGFAGGGQPRPGGTLTAANAADMKTFKGGRPGTRLGLPADNKEYLKRFYGSYADQIGRGLRNAGRKASPLVSSFIGFGRK